MALCSIEYRITFSTCPVAVTLRTRDCMFSKFITVYQSIATKRKINMSGLISILRESFIGSRLNTLLLETRIYLIDMERIKWDSHKLSLKRFLRACLPRNTAQVIPLSFRRPQTMHDALLGLRENYSGMSAVFRWQELCCLGENGYKSIGIFIF